MSLHRPSEDAIATALGAAQQMRADNNDPHHIALALQYLQSRCHDLEALLEQTERYLNFGMPEPELSQMRMLVTRLREQQGETGHDLPI